MFDDALANLEHTLDVPYPERELVLRELRGELEAAYLALRARGHAAEDAYLGALRELALDEGALSQLSAVHASAARRALAGLSPETREWIEWLAPTLALGAPIAVVTKEMPVKEYLIQGGWGVWPVLAIGLLALLLQLHRALVWFVLRDHSAPTLRRNTTTPLYLAAATLLCGLLGTLVGYYKVFSLYARGQIDAAEFHVGLAEPIPCIALATALAVLVVLIHAASQAALRALHIPERSEDVHAQPHH